MREQLEGRIRGVTVGSDWGGRFGNVTVLSSSVVFHIFNNEELNE